MRTRIPDLNGKGIAPPGLNRTIRVCDRLIDWVYAGKGNITAMTWCNLPVRRIPGIGRLTRRSTIRVIPIINIRILLIIAQAIRFKAGVQNSYCIAIPPIAVADPKAFGSGFDRISQL